MLCCGIRNFGECQIEECAFEVGLYFFVGNGQYGLANFSCRCCEFGQQLFVVYAAVCGTHGHAEFTRVFVHFPGSDPHVVDVTGVGRAPAEGFRRACHDRHCLGCHQFGLERVPMVVEVGEHIFDGGNMAQCLVVLPHDSDRCVLVVRIQGTLCKHKLVVGREAVCTDAFGEVVGLGGDCKHGAFVRPRITRLLAAHCWTLQKMLGPAHGGSAAVWTGAATVPCGDGEQQYAAVSAGVFSAADCWRLVYAMLSLLRRYKASLGTTGMTMFSPVSGVSAAGYPNLSPSVSVQYGTVNPGPTEETVQASTSSIPSGALFADDSVFQPNTSPDVVTIAVLLHKSYFTKGDTVYAPGGTIMLTYGIDDKKKQRTQHKVHLHGAILSHIPSVEKDAVKAAVGTLAEHTFPTVCVGPAVFHKHKLTYVAVAIQNVTSVSLLQPSGTLYASGKNVQAGTLLYMVYTNGCAHLSDTKSSTLLLNRRVRVVVPVSTNERVASVDVGSIELHR